jgi:hypothetical protein
MGRFFHGHKCEHKSHGQAFCTKFQWVGKIQIYQSRGSLICRIAIVCVSSRSAEFVFLIFSVRMLPGMSSDLI